MRKADERPYAGVVRQVHRWHIGSKRRIGKMRRFVLAAAMAAGLAANAECIWSWWIGAPESHSTKEVCGAAFGLASKVKSLDGSQISLCLNRADEVKRGAQVAIGYNGADTVRNGCQVAFLNSAKSASLQFGLICVNETGFLPAFIFFNFDSKMFGSSKSK